MKKLLFVGGNLYPNKVGGYEVFNYYLSDSLRTEFTVTVLNHVKEVKSYPATKTVKILNIEPSAIFTPIQYFFYLLFLKDKRTVLIFLSYSKSRWLTWWPYPVLRKLFGLKYIITIHGGGMKKWDWPLIHRSFMQKAERVIGVSERICEEYRQRAGREVEYIPPLLPFKKHNGQNETVKGKYGIKPESKVILSVGSLKPLKNPQTIIEAAGALGADYLKSNSLVFVFAGDGNLKNELIEKSKQLGITDYMRFLGNVNRDEIPALYGIADIFVMGSDFEGTPLSLLEAMFNSLIVIGSDVEGINQIIRHNVNGFLFKVKENNELATLIDKTIKMPVNDAKKIRQDARQTVDEKYRYENMLGKYIEIINEI